MNTASAEALQFVVEAWLRRPEQRQRETNKVDSRQPKFFFSSLSSAAPAGAILMSPLQRGSCKNSEITAGRGLSKPPPGDSCCNAASLPARAPPLHFVRPFLS
jgi:hypothetical protein